MKENYSVTHIENNIAVLEFPDGSFIEVDVSLLPNDVKEGNVLTLDENNCFIRDLEEENNRIQRLLDLQDKIFG